MKPYARRTSIAMIAAVALTLLSPSLSFAQATGSAGRRGPSVRQDPCTVRTMQELQDAVCQLMTRMSTLETHVGQTQTDLLDTQSELAEARTELDLFESDLDLAEVDLDAVEVDVTGLRTDVTIMDHISDVMEVDLASAEARIDLLEANPVLGLAPYVSVDTESLEGVVGPNLLFTGVNVHIRSGSGATDDGGSPIGLGNLIVGYNESSNDTRTGSHNLVVGRHHTYTSFGGFVAGFNNAVTGQESSVTAGSANEARGRWSSVSGGHSNISAGDYASVTGGNANWAVGTYSSVLGGSGNAAGSDGASVAGGLRNTAEGFCSVVSGGRNRTVSGDYDWRAGDLWEDK